MKQDIDQVIMDFDRRASKIYADLFEQFLRTTKEIEREGDENVFRMQVGKYLKDLKNSLDQQVKKSSESYGGNAPKQLQGSLSTRVNYYLQQFQHKCNTW